MQCCHLIVWFWMKDGRFTSVMRLFSERLLIVDVGGGLHRFWQRIHGHCLLLTLDSLAYTHRSGQTHGHEH